MAINTGTGNYTTACRMCTCGVAPGSVCNCAPPFNTFPTTPQLSAMSPDFPDLLFMLRLRLHVGPTAPMPFDFITAHKINDERAVVFLVVQGSPVTLEDEWPLFPSDKLITQLRLLEQK